MPRSRLYLVGLVVLLWVVTVTGAIAWAQATSPSVGGEGFQSHRSPSRTILFADASASESRPLGTTPGQSSDLSKKTSPSFKQKSLKKEDPLKELAKRLSTQALKDQSKLDASLKASQSNSSDSELRSAYPPTQNHPTSNEVRSRELLLSNPSEQKSLGTPGVPGSGGKILSGAKSPGAEELPKQLPGSGLPGGGEKTPLGLYSDSGTWILKTVTALGVVIGLIFAVRMGVNKLSGRPMMGGRNGVVQILSRTSISPRNQVILLRLGQRIIVVSEGAAGVRTLADLDDPDEVAQLLTAVSASGPRSMTRSFNQLLNRVGSEMDNPGDLAKEQGVDDAEHLVDRTRNELSGLLSKIRSMSKGGRDA